MSHHSIELAFIGPTIDEIKEALTSGLGARFEARYSDEWGGAYWATPVRGVPGLLIYPNAEDEDGPIFIDRHPEVTALLDAVDLDDEQFDFVQSLGGRPIEEYQQLSP